MRQHEYSLAGHRVGDLNTSISEMNRIKNNGGLPRQIRTTGPIRKNLEMGSS